MKYGPSPDPAYNAPPHIRLISLENEPSFLRSIVDGLARRLEPLDLNLDRVGTFPQGVVYLAPTDNSRMFSIHRSLHRELADRGVRSEWPRYQPGLWEPHCTIAVDIPQDTMDEAVTWFRSNLPIPRVRIESLAVLTYQPFGELYRHDLGRKTRLQE